MAFKRLNIEDYIVRLKEDEPDEWKYLRTAWIDFLRPIMRITNGIRLEP